MKGSSDKAYTTTPAAGARKSKNGLGVVVPVPDFRNIGVWLRALFFVNLVAFAAALVAVESVAAWLDRYVEYCFRVQPLLLLSPSPAVLVTTQSNWLLAVWAL